MARYDVPDEAWMFISSILPPERNLVTGGRPYIEHKPVMNDIMRKNGHLKFHPKAVLADKRYSSSRLRNHLTLNNIIAATPFKSNEKAGRDRRRKLNVQLYKRRNVVERCFAMLKEYRRIATRSEKMARNYLAMLKLGLIR